MIRAIAIGTVLGWTIGTAISVWCIMTSGEREVF